MRTTLITTLGVAALLAGCASTPKPPKAEESTRAPANDPAHIEALKLQAELQRARVELAIAGREAASQRMLTEAQALGLKPVPVAMRGSGIPVFDAGAVASIYTVTFPTGSTRLALPLPAQRALIEAARGAELVELRGRTDAKQENPTDAAIARQRALAPQALLLQAGIPASRIRATWQAAGDHAAPNDTAEGRAMNRRVEIVVHRIAPRPATLDERATVAAQ
ncbi:OmpA family protein [Azohydromonas aeria]|uniref:OmpA family protein n=1 Tax=Azohydromonas aeria TaxID=2590212 RepID=UPI0012F9811D|nr:OmpA family protein [Azohydromonas aeria]